MQKRTLGKTGPAVTALGFGAMELRRLDERDAGRVLNAALDGGITFIDTSPDYGLSETYIGATIASRRNEFVLASKCGCNVDGHGAPLSPAHVWTGAQLQANIEKSLRLLRTDHLDLWQLHSPSPAELAGGKHDDVIATLHRIRQQGKVRCIGMSYKNGRQDEALFPSGYAFQYLREFLAWDVFDTMQVVYGGLTLQNEQLITDVATRGLGVVVRGAVKMYRDDYPRLFAAAGLDELCADGESMTDVLIRFALCHKGISTMIIGTGSVEHVRQNIAAANKGPLPAAVYAEAKRRLAAIGVMPGLPTPPAPNQ